MITEQDLQTHDEHPPEPKSGGEQIETITTTHSPEAMRASSHPRQRGAGRRRGKLVGGSGEPGELADEDWSETQGSQGSWQMQRKIGQRLRGARGATWLERFASLKAGAVCAWIEGRDRVW